MYTKEQVAKTIDHAVLKPEMTDTDLKAHAGKCKEMGVFSMCVKPCDIKAAVELLKGSDVKVSTTLSFPHGADTSEVKAFQAKKAIEDGVDEIDMVMNIGKFLSGDDAYVVNDIKAVVDVAHQHGIPVKVIQESCYLNLEQVAKACELAYQAGADFVKTSTGFAAGSATPEIVQVMVDTVGGKMKIKPSGGIRDWKTAVAYLEQGADRLGIGASEAVLNGARTEGNY
jgi:deoxyribose-phosphate aldolase